jgi:outer membrane PBP1 activator LpoA protein
LRHRILTLLLLTFAWLSTCFAADTPPAAPEKSAAHIALLLPIKSASFGRAADAVRKGFMAAVSVAPAQLPVKVYATDESPDDILSVYLTAVQEGAKIVIGPLTRNAVSGLATSKNVSVPTIALNSPDDNGVLPSNLYLFGLSIEAEARQIARIAITEDKHNVFIVSSGTPLAIRTQQAFLDEWKKLGGDVSGQFTLPKGQDDFSALREVSAKSSADMIFLATDVAKARLVRPYLNPVATTYATSQVFAGKGSQIHNIDLNGVRFIDMPWLLEPDHTAVMVYAKPEVSGGVDLDRLYALGIDAFRLATAWLAGQVHGGFTLDGVTGKISLNGQLFERELTAAQFQEGEAVLMNKPRP